MAHLQRSRSRTDQCVSGYKCTDTSASLKPKLCRTWTEPKLKREHDLLERRLKEVWTVCAGAKAEPSWARAFLSGCAVAAPPRLFLRSSGEARYWKNQLSAIPLTPPLPLAMRRLGNNKCTDKRKSYKRGWGNRADGARSGQRGARVL